MFKFEGLTQEEAQGIINALAELPLKQSFNLFIKLNTQLQTQLNPQPEVAEKSDEKPGLSK